MIYATFKEVTLNKNREINDVLVLCSVNPGENVKEKEVIKESIKEGDRLPKLRKFPIRAWHQSISAKLILSYLIIMIVTSGIFTVIGILEENYLGIKKQTILTFLIIAIVSIIITSLLSYYISLKITTPIHKLVAASRELANGNLNSKVEIATNDEIGELAVAFNIMATTLSEREEKLKEQAKNMVMESERLAIIGQLAANVAHELNNPLVGIITYSNLLLEETPVTDHSTEFLNKIVIQANRCKDIVRGLLDFSRTPKADKTLFNINNVVEQCISLLENQALFLNIKTNLDLGDLPMIIIDPSQIERVFMNIIINAAESMNGYGLLDIVSRFDSDESSVEIQVKDTGTGITDENIEKVFDPFFTTKGAGHGVGLGLAISYGIIREHGGTITVKSKIGIGTTFIVRLPVTIHGKMRYR
jgi:two-component system NtrC family sensor kinase